MAGELIQALGEIEKERGIPKAALIDAIKSALNTAYKKNFGSAHNVSVELNEITGEVRVFAQKQVVEDAEESRGEIGLEEAQELYPDCSLDDIVWTHCGSNCQTGSYSEIARSGKKSYF